MNFTMNKEPENNMARILSFEARALGRKMERQARKLQEAAKREILNYEVIETDSDDVRGDLMSLILNAKPEGMSETDWFKELEVRGGNKAATYQRWRNMEVKTPQTRSCHDTLRVLGLAYYIGKKR